MKSELKEINPGTLPKALVRPRRPQPSIYWIVPVLAAILTGVLLYQGFLNTGPKITISFENGAGLKKGQTPVKYRGVTVGEVRGIILSTDQQRVLVNVNLDRSAASLARDGSVFWVVRPKIGMGSISGLETIVTGAYIEVQPGSGNGKKEFVGAETAPTRDEDKGVEIVLITSNIGSLKVGSPIYYRGIQVGVLGEHKLARDSRNVEVMGSIQKKYAPLVQPGSKFWNVSGINVDFGLFKGAEINVESLQSLVSGGVSFATPPSSANAASNTNQALVFDVNEKPKDEWLKWSPAIQLGINSTLKMKNEK